MASTASITKCEIRYVPDALVGEIYGKAMLGLTDGFLPVDKLELQDIPGLDHSRRAANHPRNLETLYRHYQTIDGDDKERPSQLRIRSMSLGDAIIVDGKAYYVASEGFVTVEDGVVTPVATD